MLGNDATNVLSYSFVGVCFLSQMSQVLCGFNLNDWTRARNVYVLCLLRHCKPYRIKAMPPISDVFLLFLVTKMV